MVSATAAPHQHLDVMHVNTVDRSAHAHSEEDNPANHQKSTSAKLPKPVANQVNEKKSTSTPDILDIRQNVIEMDLSNDITSMLQPERGPKQMPTMLLYDTEGLQTFEEVCRSPTPLSLQFMQDLTLKQITYLDEYYLTNAEIDVLTKHAAAIAENIQSESMVIELGSGSVTPRIAKLLPMPWDKTLMLAET